MTTATAPGKTILVGEHAVVYGRPAIAAPVWQVVATATVEDGPPGAGLRLRVRFRFLKGRTCFLFVPRRGAGSR